MSSGQGGIHLIKTLAESWSIDIATQLEEYLCIVRGGVEVTYDDGELRLSFVEAAMKILDSTVVYSKKVDFLHQLVFRALKMFRGGDLGNLLSMEDIHQKNEEVDSQQLDAKKSTKGSSLTLAQELMASSEFVPIADLIAQLPTSSRTSFYHQPNTIVEKEEEHDQDDGDDRNTLKKPPHLLRNYGLSGLSHIIDDETGALLINGNEDYSSLRITSVHQSDLSHNNNSNNNSSDDDFIVGSNGEENDVYSPEASSSHHPHALKRKMILHKQQQQQQNDEDDPWRQHDPYNENPIQTKPMFCKPFKKGLTLKVPLSFADSRIAFKKKAKAPSNISLKTSSFSSLINKEFQYILEQIQSIQKEQRAMARKRTISLSRAKHNYSSPVSFQDPDEVYDPNTGIAMDQTRMSLNFDDNDENEFIPDDDTDTNSHPLLANLISGSSYNNGNYILSGNESDVEGNLLPYKNQSYVDMVREYVERYTEAAAAWATNHQSSSAVQEWNERIEPLLKEEESRPAFDIHEYGDLIVNEVVREDRKPFVDIVKSVEHQKRLSLSATDVSLSVSNDQHNSSLSVDEVSIPKYEICRLFLATLQMVNDSRLDIDLANGEFKIYARKEKASILQQMENEIQEESETIIKTAPAKKKSKKGKKTVSNENDANMINL